MQSRLRLTLLILSVSLSRLLRCSMRAREKNFSSLLCCLWCYQTCNWFWNISLLWKQLLFTVAKKHARKDTDREKKGTQKEDKLRERTKKEKTHCTFSCMPLFSIDFVGFSFCIRIKGKKSDARTHTSYTMHSLISSQPDRKIRNKRLIINQSDYVFIIAK